MNRGKKIQKRGKSKKHKKITKQEVISALLRPTTQEQRQTQILLPSNFINVGSNASNLIAVNLALNPDIDCPAMNSLAQVFSEYRIEWVKVLLTPMTLNQGYTTFYFTETNEGIPTAAVVQEKTTDALLNTATACRIRRFEGTQSPHYIKKWMPASMEENEYQLTNTSWSRLWLAIFASTATHGPIVASTQYWSVRYWVYASFRGRK